MTAAGAVDTSCVDESNAFEQWTNWCGCIKRNCLVTQKIGAYMVPSLVDPPSASFDKSDDAIARTRCEQWKEDLLRTSMCHFCSLTQAQWFAL